LEIKLLIVDDEKLDRIGLSRQLDWESFSITTVILANNGPAAIDILKTNKIDILLTDIKMPVMSGIELAKHARNINPSLKIVFVTGYDDFDYMKVAIQIQAYEYILKPVQSDELEACIIGLVNAIYDDRKEQNEKSKLLRTADFGMPLLRQRLLLDLLFGIGNKFEERMDEYNISLKTGSMAVLLVETDDYKMAVGESDGKHKELFEIITYIPTSKQYRFEAVQIEAGRVAVLINMSADLPSQEMKETLDCIANEFLSHTMRFLNVTIGVGHITDSYRYLNASYEISVRAILSKLYSGTGRVLYFSNDNKEEIAKDADPLKSIDLELAACLTKLDLTKAMYLLNNMFDHFEQCNGNDVYAVKYLCINIVSRIEVTLLDYNISADELFGKKVNLIEDILKHNNMHDVRKLIKNIIFVSIKHLDSRRQSSSAIIVREVMSYIEANFKNDVSLNTIAKSLFYSPNYLGNIFKQETGRYFSEYLTEYRIKKAAELLQERKIKVLEASLSVGYKDMPTFIKNFKSIFGMTPSEYRARRLQ